MYIRTLGSGVVRGDDLLRLLCGSRGRRPYPRFSRGPIRPLPPVNTSLSRSVATTLLFSLLPNPSRSKKNIPSPRFFVEAAPVPTSGNHNDSALEWSGNQGTTNPSPAPHGSAIFNNQSCMLYTRVRVKSVAY